MILLQSGNEFYKDYDTKIEIIFYKSKFMTYENFISYIQHPEQLTDAQIPDLKELIEKFPYFGMARVLYLRALKNTHSIFYNSELSKTAVYVPNRRNMYFYIHPDELETKNLRERITKDGSYFDMMEKLEENGEVNKQSLKNLVEKLKVARRGLNFEK